MRVELTVLLVISFVPPCTPLPYTFPWALAGHKMVPIHRLCVRDVASRQREWLDQQLLQSEMILQSKRAARQLL